MRVFQTCLQCWPPSSERGDFDTHFFQEKNIYRFTCTAGHKTYMALQNHKHEVLAEIAMYAYVDSYYQQSILNFDSSLERAYEWYLRVSFMHKFESTDLFEKIWKPVKRLSERQIGMYMLCFAQDNNRPPPVLSQDDANLRNEVVHNGFLPTNLQVEDYAQKVITIVQHLHDVVGEKFPLAREQIVLQRIKEQRSEVPKGDPIAVTYMPMCYFLTDRDTRLSKFADIVGVYKERRTIGSGRFG